MEQLERAYLNSSELDMEMTSPMQLCNAGANSVPMRIHRGTRRPSPASVPSSSSLPSGSLVKIRWWERRVAAGCVEAARARGLRTEKRRAQGSARHGAAAAVILLSLVGICNGRPRPKCCEDKCGESSTYCGWDGCEKVYFAGEYLESLSCICSNMYEITAAQCAIWVYAGRGAWQANASALEVRLGQREAMDPGRPPSNVNVPTVGKSNAFVVPSVAAPRYETGRSAEKNGLQSSTLARSGLDENNKRTNNPFNIVFVTSEVAPYSKVGGLGDVCGALPVALAGRGHRVMVVSPRYQNGVSDHYFEGAFDAQCRVKLACFGGLHEVAYFHEYRRGVDWVFVDHPSYHRQGSPYGDTRGAFGDNQFRFTILCHAACEAPLQLALGGVVYGDKCVFVANDWHASLVPVLFAAKYRRHNVFTRSRSILAIHNLSHQGVEPGTTYGKLGLPSDWYGALEWVFPEWARKHALDKGEAVNHMKGAVVTCDRILTVSQAYAWEITTKEGGWGLDGLLRSRSAVINGITNGVDGAEWDPTTDKHLSRNYSITNRSGKAECKAALQRELGFAVKSEVPVIGFIGRLDYQKGVDIIQAGMPELLTDDVQMVMLGSGDPDYEKWMTWAESIYRSKFRGWVGFSVPVAHRITAGCDILLMPSRFEPCGLNQLYAMKYGTVPVAHCTGGLRDTIENYNSLANGGKGAGTGWTFSPLSKEAMMDGLWTAVYTYRHQKSAWAGIMHRGMSQDFSWNRAALQYEQVFEWAMMDPPYA